ncbi:MAG: J domain-containing protein [Hyphomicrobiales bacterium]|nr:J domain-containing protein [Hyphomicrobiales bacterium]OQW81669.1 MAG: hypothetical protein BVN31_10350 [Proteobacteria bacterium ST_bin15]
MRDPYQILGINRSAPEAEIKKAYRRLAKAHHPDQNQGDTKAAARFSELNQAYEILSDKGKRAQFDRGEIDGEGKPRFAGMGAGQGGGRQGPQGFEFEFGPGAGMRGGRRGGGVDPSDIFSDLFGSMRGGPQGPPPQRGADAHVKVSVPFAEAVIGAKRRIDLPTGKSLDVAIPAGTLDGQTIRLKGQGYGSANGPPGDGLVTIAVLPHALFRLDGADIRIDLPITLDEAVLGAKVRVPTLEGPVDITIAPQSNSGRTLRLRGKGAPAGSSRGDFLVRLVVILPEQSNALSQLAEEIRTKQPYSVRGHDFG